MQFRTMLKSKIHRATVTKKALHYEGSIGIDRALMDASGIAVNEKVHVLNLNNGSRFETYAIEEEENSGTIALYGPAAHLGEKGHLVIIIAYSLVEEKEVLFLKPKKVYVDKDNKVISGKK